MKILEFLTDRNGKYSSQRVYSFIALIVASILAFREPYSFDLILTFLSYSVGGKVFSKLAER